MGRLLCLYDHLYRGKLPIQWLEIVFLLRVQIINMYPFQNTHVRVIKGSSDHIANLYDI